MTENTKTAVVTGAATGLGQAYAVRLAAEGMNVVIADLADGRETLDAIERAGGSAIAVQCDVADEESVDELARRAHERFGSVQIVVNNAGVYPMNGFLDIPVAEWDRVLGTNLRSLFLVTRAFLPEMIESGWGRVVSMASTSFHQGSPGFVHYVTTKGGVVGFTRALATETGATGVTVNAIAPSIVRTTGTSGLSDYYDGIAQTQAIARTEEPSDVVGTLAFLVSDDAAFMTGQTLVVDGGGVRV